MILPYNLVQLVQNSKKRLGCGCSLIQATNVKFVGDAVIIPSEARLYSGSIDLFRRRRHGSRPSHPLLLLHHRFENGIHVAA